MRTSTALLSAAALAGALVSVWLFVELRAERLRYDEFSARVERAQQKAVPSPAGSSSNDASVAAPAAKSAAAAVPAAAQSPQEVRKPHEDWQARQRRLLEDPAYQGAWREQMRVQMASRREDMMDVLGFSGEQADGVVDQMIDWQLDMQLTPLPADMTEETLRQQRERTEARDRAHQDRLRALLGEQKRLQYQEYMESSGTRTQVGRLRSELADADALRDDQVEPLIAAMHAERSQMEKEIAEFRDSLNSEGGSPTSMQRYEEFRAKQMKATHSRIRSAAASILSGSQLKKLGTLLDRDLARQEAMIKMSRINSKLKPPEEAAAGQR